MKKPFFTDRRDAGALLAAEIMRTARDEALVLALPRGGVPVGYEVARTLKATLDTLVVRKIGAPSDPEYAVGAVAPGDVIIYDDAALSRLGLERRALDGTVAAELEEMDRRMTHYRSGDWSADAFAPTVILVDDGLATGLTARAAIESVRLMRKPKTLVFAAPVAAAGAAKNARDIVDEAVFLFEPRDLASVSRSYAEFDQVSDDDVVRYLELSASERAGGGTSAAKVY